MHACMRVISIAVRPALTLYKFDSGSFKALKYYYYYYYYKHFTAL